MHFEFQFKHEFGFEHAMNSDLRFELEGFEVQFELASDSEMRCEFEFEFELAFEIELRFDAEFRFGFEI